MRREAERTLYSLSSNYQVITSGVRYEVVVIDNGSESPLDASWVQKFGPNFHYRYFDTESASPAAAVNFGARSVRGRFLAVIVDGARMVSPGLINSSLNALQSFAKPFVCSLAWHLGPDIQHKAILQGYNQMKEDDLLSQINWRSNGYRLFQISTIAPSSRKGFLGGMPSECSWFAMPTTEFLEIGGFDERFQSPGGGLVNHDFLNRVLMHKLPSPVVILGEGTFHQMHGGIATNSKLGSHPGPAFAKEYKKIHGHGYVKELPQQTFYFGSMPSEAKKYVNRC